jgi:UDP-glucose 4-epimerase
MGPLEIGDIRDRGKLDEVLRKYKPLAIVHFAAAIEVGESVQDPGRYHENNVAGSITLLRAAQAAGIDKIVFSSTCATYGIPLSVPMNESHPAVAYQPVRSKQAHRRANIEGLGPLPRLSVVHFAVFQRCRRRPRRKDWRMAFAIETALGRRPHFQALGTDYDTRDGTCVRDFVHVLDLADAHSRAIQHLLNNGASHALNLGTGHGTTVRELLETVKRVAGRDLNVKYGPRRQGDSPILVADSTLANRTIGGFPAMISGRSSIRPGTGT